MFENLLKVIVIGDSTVGKTQLTLRFVDGTFSTATMTTIGVDFKSKAVRVRGNEYKLQIWDTAGQEKFRTITQAYYRRARGVAIVFDWSQPDSFHHVTDWLDSLHEEHAKGTIPIVLIGNKEDLEHRVDDEDAQALAKAQGIELFSASAKLGNGIDSAFEKLAELVVDNAANADPLDPPAVAPLKDETLTKTKTKAKAKKGIC
jgi:Ras-related protein Rab-8A